MTRRSLIAVFAAFCLALLGVLTGTPAQAATTQQTWLTFFGWFDNTPPSGDIAHPVIHNSAGGRGTFADPITLATATQEMPVGTKIYVPRFKKYFIMEDDCQECEADWTGHGPDGGPNLRHVDLWVGGKNGSPFDSINCEDALTRTNDDGSVLLEPVIANPASTEVFDPTPLFNETTGECYGGAQPNITVGQYKNGSNGQCLDDPNNSSTTGTQLKTAACNGSAEQQFKFEGAFLIINNRCAGMSSSKIVLQTCSGGPAQQWSVNPNGTISDIQTGQKCVGISGTSVVARSCSGSASQWTFTDSSTPPGTTTRYEGENGTISQGILETIHPGFSGAGYVNNDNVSGSFNEVTVNATTAGSATVAIRYANGTTTARATSISVNGSAVTTVSFGPTANWDTWATKTITVSLNAGSNTFRVTGTSAAGPPNLDFYDVTTS